jgi:hypothetical protein
MERFEACLGLLYQGLMRCTLYLYPHGMLSVDTMLTAKYNVRRDTSHQPLMREADIASVTFTSSSILTPLIARKDFIPHRSREGFTPYERLTISTYLIPTTIKLKFFIYLSAKINRQGQITESARIQNSNNKNKH